MELWGVKAIKTMVFVLPDRQAVSQTWLFRVLSVFNLEDKENTGVLMQKTCRGFSVYSHFTVLPS